MSSRLLTVVETPLFMKKAAGLFDEAELASLISFLAANPEAGRLIQGTGGLRKLRWQAKREGQAWWRASHILLP